MLVNSLANLQHCLRRGVGPWKVICLSVRPSRARRSRWRQQLLKTVLLCTACTRCTNTETAGMPAAAAARLAAVNPFASPLSQLCQPRPHLAGCELFGLCNQVRETTALCAPSSLLGDVCAMDAPWLAQCAGYRAQCREDGTCDSRLASLPTSAELERLVASVCEQMPKMIACTAESPPGPLEQLAALCADMPGMAQCAAMRAVCASVRVKGPLALARALSCGDEAAPAPEMRMWLHGGLRDYVLFESWVPRNGGEGFLAVAFAVALAAASIGLRSLRAHGESAWWADFRSFTLTLPSSPAAWRANAQRALLQAVGFVLGALSLCVPVVLTMLRAADMMVMLVVRPCFARA